MSSARARPSFFVLGAPKCGTTSLHQALVGHPDICMSEEKEPRFFELRYDLGIEAYERETFPRYEGQRAVGEASPMYLMLPFVAERIVRHYPDARLIAILREPYDRAHSAWWMHFSAGREHLTFENAVAENLERLRSGVSFEGSAGAYLWRRNAEIIRRDRSMLFRTYLDAGLYGRALERYLELFPREQLLVLLFDELQRDRSSVLKRVLRFIGVDESVELGVPHSNPAVDERWARFMRWAGPLARRGLIPRPLITGGKRALAGRRPNPPTRLSSGVNETVTSLFKMDLSTLHRLIPDLEVPGAWRDRLEPGER